MKKIFIKMASVVVGWTLIIFLQGFIRDFFNIDPRIWFFTQFFGFFILIVATGVIFMTEIMFIREYVRENSWSEFWWLVWEKTFGSEVFRKIFSPIKNIFIKIFKNKAIRIIFNIANILISWWLVWEKTFGSKVFRKIFSPIKNIFIKIFKNKDIRIIFNIVYILTSLLLLMCVCYRFFFTEDFYGSYITVIIYLISFTLCFLISLFKAIFIKRNRTIINIITPVIPGMVLLLEILFN